MQHFQRMKDSLGIPPNSQMKKILISSTPVLKTAWTAETYLNSAETQNF